MVNYKQKHNANHRPRCISNSVQVDPVGRQHKGSKATLTKDLPPPITGQEAERIASEISNTLSKNSKQR